MMPTRKPTKRPCRMEGSVIRCTDNFDSYTTQYFDLVADIILVWNPKPANGHESCNVHMAKSKTRYCSQFTSPPYTSYATCGCLIRSLRFGTAHFAQISWRKECNYRAIPWGWYWVVTQCLLSIIVPLSSCFLAAERYPRNIRNRLAWYNLICGAVSRIISPYKSTSFHDSILSLETWEYVGISLLPCSWICEPRRNPHRKFFPFRLGLDLTSSNIPKCPGFWRARNSEFQNEHGRETIQCLDRSAP